MTLIIWVRRKYVDVALPAGDNLSMWEVCCRGTLLVALSGKSIVIADPSVSGIKGIIQRFEETATGMNVSGTWDIDREHCSPIAWLFLAFRAVIHDSQFLRGLNGAFILQNCLFAC